MSATDPVADPPAYVQPSWFDNLKAQTRHTLLLLAGSLVTACLLWASQNGDTILAALNIPPALYPFAATALGSLILAATKITKQYGFVGGDGGDSTGTGADITGVRDNTTPPPEVAEPMGDHAADPATADAPLDVSDLPADPAV
jgi:hypothetical protein